MKKHIGKKTLSLLLAALMVLTAIPLAAVPATAASGTLKQNGWAIISSNGARWNQSAKTFNVCNDGTQDAVSVGFIDFDISGINGTVDAKLNVSGKNSGNSNYNGEAFLEIFSIAPDKRPKVSGADKTTFSGIFGSGNWTAYNSYTHANNAKSTLGIKNQPAIAIMASKEMDNDQTKAYSFDISEAVNNAKRAGQDKLYLAFINPRSYKGNPTWSDINVFYDTANITYTEGNSNEVAFSAAVTLYKTTSNPRGTADKQTICSDGSNGNTTAAFINFDLSKVPDSASSISFVTSAWRANSSNDKVTADIYSIDSTKAPKMNAGTGTQATVPYDEAFGTGTPNITQAKTYFGATNSIGTIATNDLSASASTITRDITAAVKEAKSAGKTTLCLMIINPTNYSGSDANGWSDIYFNPQQTKLVYSESAGTNAYGNFNSGKYYVKLVLKIFDDGCWSNGINKAWIGFYYKTNNGTGEEQYVDMPVAPGTFETAGNKTLEYVLDGFPTKIMTDCGGISSTSNFACQPQQLFVGAYAGDYHLISQDVETAYQEKRSLQNQITRVKTWWYKDDSTINFPYATTFDWNPAPAETFVPKSGANTVLGSVVAKDQYGVVMGTEYTATLEKVAKSGSLSTIPNTGLSSVKENTADFNVSVAETAKVANTDYFYGRLIIDVADANASYIGKNSKEFKIENQKETVTLAPNGGNLSKDSYQIYYGSALNAEINKPLNGNTAFPPEATREGYDFQGFFTTSSTAGSKITETEVINFDRTFYARWTIKSYTVTFLNPDGSVLSEVPVNHGNSANAPSAPSKAFDETNHYVFTSWDTDFTNVTENLTVKPLYDTVAHNLVRDTSKDIAATCETDGQYFYKCDGCNYTTYKDGDKATDHNWQETSRTDATCVKDGTIYYSCKNPNCTATKTETIGALGHNYVETITQAPTCTGEGVKKFICSRCKETDPTQGGNTGLPVDPSGHKWSEWETTKEPTCTVPGSKRAHCLNENCEFSTAFYVEEIPALTHDFSTELFTKESTCVEPGYTYHKCLRENCDGIDMVETNRPLKDHVLGVWEYSVNPDCVNGGEQVKKCTNCGNIIEKEAVDALGHDYQNYSKTSDASCTEPAKETGTCTRCKTTDTRYVDGSEALGHSFTNYVSNNNATCLKNCTETAKCDRCTATDTREIENTSLGHSFTKYVSNKDATCTKDGTKTAKCDRLCGVTDTITDEGSKLPHTVTSYTDMDDATCTKNETQKGVCSVCGTEVIREKEGSKLPHSFKTYVHKSDATCLEPATEEAFCEYGCGTTDGRSVGEKADHNFPDPVNEKELYTSNDNATCIKGGTMTAKCKTPGCNAKTTVADPDAVPHHRMNWISDNNATCTEDGTKHGSCIYGCGHTEENVIDEGSKLGHRFRDYKYNNDATCTEDGTRTAQCERIFDVTTTDADGNTVTEKVRCEETEEVPAKGTALGHDWGEWAFVKDSDGNDLTPDCETGGEQERFCKREDCDERETRVIGATGHNYEWETIDQLDADGNKLPADCERGYQKIKVCSVCKEKDKNSLTTVPGGAHHYVVDTVEATCVKDGSRTVYCDVCKNEKTYETTVIKATGHLNTEIKEGTAVAPTCKDEGYTGDIVCLACGEVVEKGKEIPKTDVHTFSEYTVITPATCTKNATEKAVCSVCKNAEDTREVYGSKLGHKFGSYSDSIPATCTEDATQVAKCENSYIVKSIDENGNEVETLVHCDATDVIKKAGTALGHDWSEWVTVTPATCKNEGLAKKTCKRDNCGKEVEKVLRQLSHTESDWIVDEEATCTKVGKRHKECTAGCGYVFATEEIPMKDHDFIVTETTATCIDDGFSTYTCTICGATKKGEVVHALGHEYDDWVITKPATCKRRGEKTVSCKRCGILLATEYIEKTDHLDADGDGKCDECGTTVDTNPNPSDCGCICHKTFWLMRIIYAICRFFWKLFRIRATCPCGSIHY